jgi:hypothetical protein
MSATRKDKIENVLAQCERIESAEGVNQAWIRLCRELRFLSDPESRPPRFEHLLHAVWIAASNDQS